MTNTQQSQALWRDYKEKKKTPKWFHFFARALLLHSHVSSDGKSHHLTGILPLEHSGRWHSKLKIYVSKLGSKPSALPQNWLLSSPSSHAITHVTQSHFCRAIFKRFPKYFITAPVSVQHHLILALNSNDFIPDNLSCKVQWNMRRSCKHPDACHTYPVRNYKIKLLRPEKWAVNNVAERN